MNTPQPNNFMDYPNKPPIPKEAMQNQPNNLNASDDWLDEILATAKAKIVETMNNTTVSPNSKEIELTHTGEFKDGDIVNVRINNFIGHPIYAGTIDGYGLHLNKEIPYKIDVGTQISLLAYPEAKAAIIQHIQKEVRKAYKAGYVRGIKVESAVRDLAEEDNALKK